MSYTPPQFRLQLNTQGRHNQYLFTKDHYFITLWNALTPEQKEVYNRLAQPFGQSGFILALAINKRVSMVWKVLNKYNDGDITRDRALWLFPQLESEI